MKIMIMDLQQVPSPSKPGETETIIDLFEQILRQLPMEAIPRGYDQYRLFKKLYSAFKKAREEKKLELEVDVYNVLKGLIHKYMFSIYAANEEHDGDLEKFMNLLPVEVEVKEVKDPKKQTKQTEGK